jgi:hypothetical protein
VNIFLHGTHQQQQYITISCFPGLIYYHFQLSIATFVYFTSLAMLSRNLNLALLFGGLTLTSAFAVPGLQKRDTTAELTIGSTYVPLSTVDGAQFVGDSLRAVCASTGCDSGSPQVRKKEKKRHCAHYSIST